MKEFLESLSELLHNHDTFKTELLVLNDAITNNHQETGITEKKEALTKIIQLTEETIGSIIRERTIHSDHMKISAPLQPDLTYELPEISTSSLPISIIGQMRELRGIQALLGSCSANWAIGINITARWSLDGYNYKGIIMAVTRYYLFIVEFIKNGNQEILKIGDLSNFDHILDSVHKPIYPPKIRKIDETVFALREIQKKISINNNDDTETTVRKRKVLRNLKKKKRFIEMDLVQKEKSDNWKKFLLIKKNKNISKNKDSIFKTTTFGKVGVIGSGRGMTDCGSRMKYSFKED
jgi:hypothetical protein